MQAFIKMGELAYEKGPDALPEWVALTFHEMPERTRIELASMLLEHYIKFYDPRQWLPQTRFGSGIVPGMRELLSNVGYWGGKSGKYMLVLRFTAFDPTRT